MVSSYSEVGGIMWFEAIQSWVVLLGLRLFSIGSYIVV